MARKPYLVGIVGGSASGKTMFLRELATRLPAQACAIVSVDNYYRPLEDQARDEQGFPNFDLPAALHSEALIEDLRALLRGETVQRSEYTFNHRQRQGQIVTVSPADVILVEGLFLFHHAEIRELFDLRVFIDARAETCKERRLRRDAEERGYPREHAEYQWHNHVLPAYRDFIQPYREEAHIIVTNHVSFSKGLEVVLDHIRAKCGPQKSDPLGNGG